MIVAVAPIVMAPFMIAVGMGGTITLRVGAVGPAVPVMAVVPIAVREANGNIAEIKSDADRGVDRTRAAGQKSRDKGGFDKVIMVPRFCRSRDGAIAKVTPRARAGFPGACRIMSSDLTADRAPVCASSVTDRGAPQTSSSPNADAGRWRARSGRYCRSIVRA